MTRTPLYFKRGTSTGPRPYRRMVRSIRSAWKVANAAEAKIQRVRAVADAWEYYASENGNVRTAWAAKLIRNALDGDA